MTELEKKIPITIDLGGLIAIFGHSLYTEFGAIVRELVQNAHDGIVEDIIANSRRTKARRTQTSRSEYRIDIAYSDSDALLVVSDTGIGMSPEDLQQKLNNFARSDKRKLQQALTGTGEETPDQLIGEYGVGFLSAMAVSDTVEVWTAHAGSSPTVWSFNKGDKHAEVRPTSENEILTLRERHRIPAALNGTTIVCHLSKVIVGEYSVDPLSILGGVSHYVRILSYPVYFNGNLLNPLPSAWQAPAKATEKDWRQAITEMNLDEPAYVIPLYSPTKELDLQGALWFPVRRRILQTEGQLDIYIKRMFVVCDDAIIMPKWARFLHGMLNSNRLRRIVSGNTFKADSYASEVTKFLTEKIHETFRTLRTVGDDEYWNIIGPHDDVIKESAVDNPELLDIIWDKMRLRVRTRRLTIPTYLDELERATGITNEIYFFENKAQEFAANLVSDSTHIPVFDLCGRADNLFASAACELQGIQKVNFRTLADKLFQPLKQDEADTYKTLVAACAESNIAADLRRYEPGHLPAVLIEDRTLLERREELLRGLRGAIGERQRQVITDIEDLFRRDRAANRGVAFYLNVSNDLIRELRDAPYDAQAAVCLALYNISYMSAVPELRRSEVQAVYASICSVLMDLLRQAKVPREKPDKISQQDSPTVPFKRGTKSETDQNRPTRLMLSMPYEKRYDQVEKAVREVFESDPYYFEVVLARDFMMEGRIIESVRAHIERSDAFIADISDANPSVMMEVGAALIACAGPIFLLRNSGESKAEIPADLRAELQICYGRTDDTVNEIAASIRASLERNGTPSHRDMQILLKDRKHRALTRTVLHQIRYRLRDDEIARLSKKFATLDTILAAPAAEIAAATNMSDRDAEDFRTSLRSYTASTNR